MARSIAEKRGGVTLESLISDRGIQVPDWDPTNPRSIAAWEHLARSYAEQASGEVRAVLGASLRPGSVWENVELPALRANPKVTKVTAIDPKSEVERVIFSRYK